VIALALVVLAAAPVRIGSKKFTESVVLGDVLTELARSSGHAAEHRRELGGTEVLWAALASGQIDAYPEYTGTIAEQILHGGSTAELAQLRAALRARGILVSEPLGFDDTYAIGMPAEEARRRGVHTLSQLAQQPVRLGLSDEFLHRADGWPKLRAAYGFAHAEVKSLDHDLAYRALAGGAIDATDLYSTDAEIAYYHLVTLDDDRGVFPPYQAVVLYRADLEKRAPEVVAAWGRLAGRVPAETMQRLNARAKLEGVPETRVAADFLHDQLGVTVTVAQAGLFARLWQRLREHLYLVSVSLLAAVLVSIPLGVLASRRRRVGQLVLGLAGVVQTIPSLALLVFMIPLLGIGARPAIVALFLYSLLPIIRNTHAGLVGIAPELRESAEALGLSRRTMLWRIELPLASPQILAGIQTSAVINVGTATLGALIGAGGLGQPILSGIRLDDVPLILEGAVPAALLALAVQGLFELLARIVVPKGLRLE
jgi:osmoprotectant transport system permease protein